MSPQAFPKEVIPTSALLHSSGPPESPYAVNINAYDLYTYSWQSGDNNIFTYNTKRTYLTGVCYAFTVRSSTYHVFGDHGVTVVILTRVAFRSVDHGHIDRHQDIWHWRVLVLSCLAPSCNQTCLATFWLTHSLTQLERFDSFGYLCSFFKLKIRGALCKWSQLI